jgi:AcrR family transcriptional regulator
VETRIRILKAARTVINQRGYPAATFQAIALEADLSRPTLHYYFSTRDEIYAALVEEAEELVTGWITRAGNCDTLAESLSALVATMYETDRRDRSQVSFLISARLEATRNPELRDDRRDALRCYLMTLVGDAVQRGELPADTCVTPIADMLHSVLWGVGLCAGFPDRGATMSAITKQLRILFSHGLLGAPSVATISDDTCRDTPNAVGGRP